MKTKLVKRYGTILRGPLSKISTRVLPIYVHIFDSIKSWQFPKYIIALSKYTQQ